MVSAGMGHNEHRAEKLVVDILACEDVSDAQQVGLISRIIMWIYFWVELLVSPSMPLPVCLNLNSLLVILFLTIEIFLYYERMFFKYLVLSSISVLYYFSVCLVFICFVFSNLFPP